MQTLACSKCKNKMGIIYTYLLLVFPSVQIFRFDAPRDEDRRYLWPNSGRGIASLFTDARSGVRKCLNTTWKETTLKISLSWQKQHNGTKSKKRIICIPGQSESSNTRPVNYETVFHPVGPQNLHGLPWKVLYTILTCISSFWNSFNQI